MHNPRFTYYSPASPAEACAMLSRLEGRAVVVAGGTDIVPRMKQRLVSPEAVISLSRLENLNYIKEEGGWLEIGALTRVRELERSEAVGRLFPALGKAAGLIGGPVHRAMGTVGGNLCLENRCYYYNQSSFWRKSVETCLKAGGAVCHMARSGRRCYAVYSADLAPVLLLLEAKVVVADAAGEREIPLNQFFLDDGQKSNVLGGDELLTAVRIPVPPARAVADYIKIRPRDAVDFPVVGTAVMVRDCGNGVDIRMAFTGIGSRPFLLETGSFTRPWDDEEILERAGRLTSENVRPVSRMGGSGAYKRRLAGVSVADGLKACLKGF